MVNNTVNNRRVRPAGINDSCIIVGTQIVQKEKEIDAVGKASRKVAGKGDFLTIKAYPGGNPNKAKTGKDER